MDMIDIFIFLAESILLGSMTFLAVCRVKQATFDWKQIGRIKDLLQYR